MTSIPENFYYSDTGEYINHQIGNDTVLPKIHLPEPIAAHAFISINQSTSFLIAGSRVNKWMSNKTHFFNIDSNEWKNGPELLQARCVHAAGVLTDHTTGNRHVAVVGGIGNGAWPAEVLDSVELLLHGEHSWTQGLFICKHFSLPIDKFVIFLLRSTLAKAAC